MSAGTCAVCGGPATGYIAMDGIATDYCSQHYNEVWSKDDDWHELVKLVRMVDEQ